jgi:transcriptional regulatory protein RtcR
LRERLEDLEPNLDHELARNSADKRRVHFSREARERYLAFAHAAPWPGNFRDLAGSVQRMATLATGGRITERDVEEEIETLRSTWAEDDAPVAAPAPASSWPPATPRALAALGDRAAGFDVAKLVELESILMACEVSPTLSAAGRLLYGVSGKKKAKSNDAQRVRYALASFGLDREAIFGGKFRKDE